MTLEWVRIQVDHACIPTVSQLHIIEASRIMAIIDEDIVGLDVCDSVRTSGDQEKATKLTCVDIAPFVKCVECLKHVLSDKFDISFLEPPLIRCIKQVVI